MSGSTRIDPLAIAEATRRALLDVAMRAYEDAGLSGVCAEGRWEVAIGAMRDYDTSRIASDRGATQP